MEQSRIAINKCPVKTAMKYLGKRWTFEIIRDLFFQNRRFSEFLELNEGLSNKMLSQRLKELENAGIVNKLILSKTPLKIEYELTPRGMRLNRVLYEIALFAYNFHKEELFESEPPSLEAMQAYSGRIFCLKSV
jgi:DNA-binding HxlR family transcriptional regulator